MPSVPLCRVTSGEYRREQNSHMSARTKLLQWTDEKLKLVSSLKDHEQLMGIQARMHSTAQEYYRQRGKRAHNQLARLGVRSQRVFKANNTIIVNLKNKCMPSVKV